MYQFIYFIGESWYWEILESKSAIAGIYKSNDAGIFY